MGRSSDVACSILFLLNLSAEGMIYLSFINFWWFVEPKLFKRQEIAKNGQEYMKFYSNMEWSLQQIYSKTYCPEIMQLLFKINLLLKWVHNFTTAQI